MKEYLEILQEHWIAAILSCLTAWICYSSILKPYFEFRKLGLPGPTPIPIIGSLIFLKNRRKMYLGFVEMGKKYGQLYCISIFGTNAIVTSDKEIMKEIMIKQFNKFNGRRAIHQYLRPRNITSNIITSTTVDIWTKLRHTLSPAFSALKLKQVCGLLNESCDTFNMKLKNVADKEEIIPIYEWMKKMTLEIILSSAFGLKAETQLNEDDPISKIARGVMRPPQWLNVLSAIPVIRTIIATLPDPMNILEIVELAKDIIKNRLSFDAAQKRKDLLQLMLDARNEEEGKKLTDDQIVAQSIIFLIAGFGTTSTVLGFICYQLVTHNHVQEKIQKEIDAHWPEEEEIPSYETITKMTYLDMVIQETLRMYPPGTATVRLCNESCYIKGVHFKKDTTVIFPTYAIHHNPDIYPDPEKFNPERFAPAEKAKRDQMDFLPFGHGPKNCIAMRFALIEIKTVLVRMLKEYTLKVCPKTKIPMDPFMEKLVLRPEDEVWVQIASRKKSD